MVADKIGCTFRKNAARNIVQSLDRNAAGHRLIWHLAVLNLDPELKMDNCFVVLLAGFVCGVIVMIGLIVWAAMPDKEEKQ